MKKITIASFVLVALIGLLIAATPKKQMQPDLETSFLNFHDAVQLFDSDTAAARPLIESAAETLHANWSDAEILSFIDSRWPSPQAIYYNCIYHCTYDEYTECMIYHNYHDEEVATFNPECIKQHIAACKRKNCGTP